MSKSFIRGMLLLIVCPDVIGHLVFILSTLKLNVITRINGWGNNIKCWIAGVFQSLRVLFCEFGHPECVISQSVLAHPVLQSSEAQRPSFLSLWKKVLTLKGSRQLIYLFWQKSWQLIPWQWTQITTCLVCCGRAVWPEIAGLSVPWISFDIKGTNGNISRTGFHALINAVRI